MGLDDGVCGLEYFHASIFASLADLSYLVALAEDDVLPLAGFALSIAPPRLLRRIVCAHLLHSSPLAPTNLEHEKRLRIMNGHNCVETGFSSLRVRALTMQTVYRYMFLLQFTGQLFENERHICNLRVNNSQNWNVLNGTSRD